MHQDDASTVTKALGGRWHGGYGTAPCPVCQPERNRTQDGLTITDGRHGLLLHCKKSGCGFTDILTAAGLRGGGYTRPAPTPAAPMHDPAGRSERIAQRLWEESLSIHGTPAEAYLRRRGITCTLPTSLRFLPDAVHTPSATRWPCLLAQVDGGTGFAVHRTFLSPDGNGKAPVEPVKMMLGTVSGGAVRLSAGGSRLVVAEGIESALSLLSGLLDAPESVWAALSTSGMRGLRLPREPGRLLVALDGDTPGRAAGMHLAERAHAAGWQVSTADPGDGRDWNDHVRGMEVAA